MVALYIVQMYGGIMRTLMLILSMMIAAPVMAESLFDMGGADIDPTHRQQQSYSRQYERDTQPIQQPDQSWVNEREPEHRYGGNFQQQLREDYPY